MLEELVTRARAERWRSASMRAPAVSMPTSCSTRWTGCAPIRRCALELVYAWADEATLLRRYTETRRRHPLAPQGRVTDGIARGEDADGAACARRPIW